jgi:hypothetical protein
MRAQNAKAEGWLSRAIRKNMTTNEYLSFIEVGNRKVNVPRGTLGSSLSAIDAAKEEYTGFFYSDKDAFRNLTPNEIQELDTFQFQEWLEKAPERELRVFSEWDFQG